MREKTEYAIEVPGRGYFETWNSTVCDGGEQMRTIESLAVAEDCLDSAKLKYTAMGCPEVAKTLRIAQRRATLTYSDWEPVK